MRLRRLIEESPLLLPRTRPVFFLLVVLLVTAVRRGDAFASSTTILPDHRSSSNRVPSSAAALAAATVPSNVQEAWGIVPRTTNFPGANFPLGGSDSRQPAPPILQLPNFLTASECAQIRHWAEQAMQDGADECDDYLNYRVNQEIENEGGESSEGRALIEECAASLTASGSSSSGDSRTETAAAAAAAAAATTIGLSAKNKGGFRIRLDNQFVETMLKERLLDVLGMPNREFVFEEGAWIRPTPRTVVVRDKTVVFYGGGDGVPPHVDGKDGTLLVYLSDVAEGVGGRTIFPEDGFAQVPVQGTALLYRSFDELLHYSEAMRPGNEKWIMQLLLDYNHSYQVGDTITNFRTGQSYVWQGDKSK